MSQWIEISRVNKWFGKGRKKKQVISNLTIILAENEVYGFLGPNGAGKSTTIKMLLGFLKVDSGLMRVGGKIVGQDEYRNLLGYLPELPFFYPHLTARETLRMSGRLSGMNKEDIRKQTTILLDRMKLTHAINQRVGGFSKGMKQRLGLANALIHNPPILILDEPMSGLDPMGRHQVKALIQELKSEGKTIFLSSHILSDIEELCDHIGIIHQGELLYSGNLVDFMTEGQTLEDRFMEVISEKNDAVPA